MIQSETVTIPTNKYGIRDKDIVMNEIMRKIYVYLINMHNKLFNNIYLIILVFIILLNKTKVL